MPRGIDLHIPFPSRISPDVEAADARHLDWPRSFGLLDTEEARQRHVVARYADLSARFSPLAVGADLDLAVDQNSWYFIIDDAFDTPPGPTRELVEAHLAALDRPPRPDAGPLVLAFADMWRRSQEGMSPTWRARATRHLRHYLLGCRYEARIRGRGRRLSLPDYLRVRRCTVGVQPALDLAERLGRFEVPARAFDSEHQTAMRRAVIEIVIITNDLYSVEKEEAVGDVNNTVLILERSRTHAEAIELVTDMVRQRSEAYLELERHLPALSRDLTLDPGEREAVERYATDGMRAIARGVYDWSERTDRYSIGCIGSTFGARRSLSDP